MKKICAFFVGLVLFLGAETAQAGRDVVLTLPAETLLEAVQKVLPMPIPLQHSTVQGNLTLERLDRLHVNGNVISAQGVLGGRNMTVTANVAGHPVSVKLGEVKLPVTCNLRTRFDQASGRLIVKPTFSQGTQGGQGDGLSGLLDNLAGKEYAVDLDALKKLDLDAGNQILRLGLRPTNLVGQDNSLILSLQPQISARAKR